MQQLISLLVENKPGALMRVAGVLTSRGYNIESLTVARTLDPTLSSMTIVANVEAPMRELLIKQIRRDVRFKGLLDLWLIVHVPFAFATCAAVIAHVFVVFWYR